MLRHIVFFKFKAEAPSENRAAFVAMLRDLPAKIPFIQKPEVGEDIVHSARSYHAALSFGFASLDELQTYATHPDHLPVIAYGKEICQATVAVDFEL